MKEQDEQDRFWRQDKKINILPPKAILLILFSSCLLFSQVNHSPKKVFLLGEEGGGTGGVRVCFEEEKNFGVEMG